MKEIDILNEYMANIIVEINNLYNLKFNSKNNNLNLKKYCKKFTKIYTVIAERIKILNGYPITNLLKIEELSQIKSMQSRDYTDDMILEVLENDFSYLKEYSKDLINFFSKKTDVYTSHMLLEIMMYLEKEIWFIKKQKN